jgi:hypothetical protein
MSRGRCRWPALPWPGVRASSTPERRPSSTLRERPGRLGGRTFQLRLREPGPRRARSQGCPLRRQRSLPGPAAACPRSTPCQLPMFPAPSRPLWTTGPRRCWRAPPECWVPWLVKAWPGTVLHPKLVLQPGTVLCLYLCQDGRIRTAAPSPQGAPHPAEAHPRRGVGPNRHPGRSSRRPRWRWPEPLPALRAAVRVRLAAILRAPRIQPVPDVRLATRRHPATRMQPAP